MAMLPVRSTVLSPGRAWGTLRLSGIRHLSAGGQRRPIPQLLNIAQSRWLMRIALHDVLKLFAGLLEFSLFV